MSKIKILTVAVLLLFVLNAATLAFILFSPGPHPERRCRMQGPPDAYISEKLGFTGAQKEAYLVLDAGHRTRVMAIRDSMHVLRNGVFSLLLEEKTDSAAVSLLMERGCRIKSSEIQSHYEYFIGIKNLCRPDQLESYRGMIRELASSPDPPGPER